MTENHKKSRAYITIEASNTGLEIFMPKSFLGDFHKKLDELNLDHMVYLDGENNTLLPLKYHEGEHGVIIKIMSMEKRNERN